MVFGDAISSVWYPIGKTYLAVQNDISNFQTSNTNDFYEVFNNVSKPPNSSYNRLYTKKRLARKIDLVSWTIIGFIVGLIWYFARSGKAERESDKEMVKKEALPIILTCTGIGLFIGLLGVASLLVPAWCMWPYRRYLAQLTTRCGTKFSNQELLKECFEQFNQNIWTMKMADYNRETAYKTARIRSNINMNVRNVN